MYMQRVSSHKNTNNKSINLSLSLKNTTTDPRHKRQTPQSDPFLLEYPPTPVRAYLS